MCRDPWLVAGLCALCGLGILIAFFGRDAGITLDEQLQVDYGNRVLAWFSSGFRNQSAATFANLYLYGGLFDAPAQWLCRYSPLGVYDTRHVLTACIAVLGAVATWKMAAMFGGSLAGFLAASILMLTPAWTGHGLFNPKDIPFAVAAAFVVHACMRMVAAKRALSPGDVAYAAIAIGIALGVRPGGLFLVGYFVLAVATALAIEIWERVHLQQTQQLLRTGLRGLALSFAALLLMWLLMLSAWPWAQLSPFDRPLEAAAAASHFDWRGSMLFNGKHVSGRKVPPQYLPVWFAITLPEFYALAFASGVLAWLARRRLRPVTVRQRCAGLLLCLSVIFPVTAMIVLHVVLYDAYRHALFILPPLAAAAGASLAAFFNSDRLGRPLRVVGTCAYLALALTTLNDMVRLHPYEYIYFNRSFGGLRAASGRFETDYWGASYYEGLAWLVANVTPEPGKPVRVKWCNSTVPLGYYLPRWPGAGERFALSAKFETYDYYLGIPRYMCRQPKGEIVHRVERDGVTLLNVVRTSSESSAQ